MSETVHVTVEVPRWVYRMLKTAAKSERVEPAVYITHVLKIVAFLSPAERASARRRLMRWTQVRHLWLQHMSAAEIAQTLRINVKTVYPIVHHLNREDRNS